MRKLSLLFGILLISVFIIGPAVAQDGPTELGQQVLDAHTDCEVDLTGQTVTLYHIGDLSGPYAFITQPLVAAIADAIKFYNANGGLCGATLATFNEDTGGNLDATQAAYDRFKADFPDMKFLLLYASPDAELLREQLAEDEIVSAISAGSIEGLYGEDGATPGWIFATNPLYADQLGSFCEFAGANPDMYPDPVVGYLSWPGAFGEAAYTPETIAYCAEQGVTILDTPQFFLPTDTDITNQILNLTDAGANILYTNTLASGPVLISETLRALGLEGEVKLAGVNWVMDVSVGLLSSQRMGDGMPAVNGMVGSMPFYWWTERTQPGIAFINEQAAENERQLSTQNIAYLLSWGSVNLFVEVYTQTVNRVGSLDAVTGAELKATMESLDYDIVLGIAKANWGTERRATSANRMAMMAFLNSTGTGPATSRDDLMTVETPNGLIAVPIVIPLTEFAPAPDLRPGMMGE